MSNEQLKILHSPVSISSNKTRKISYKRLFLFGYFFITGWGLFWVLSFFLLATRTHAKTAFVPNLEDMTFRTFPAMESEGTVEISSDDIEQLGFNPNRSWQAGDTIDTIIQLGDISEGFGAENFTLKEIQQLVNFDINRLSLRDFGIIQFQTIGSLVQAIPNLKRQKIRTIAPLRDLIIKTQCRGRSRNCRWLNRSLNKVARNRRLSSLPLYQLPLENYQFSDIPGLSDTALKKFNQWEQVFISEIPGLNQVPFSSFPNPLSINGIEVAQIDITFNQAEYEATRAISGSHKEGFDKACTGGCAHIELGGNPLMLGKQWVSGNSQQVQGGHGILGVMFGGVEPTGRHPFGDGFKVVIGDIDETTATVETELYFRICKRGWINLGCSPYGIGPIPFLTFQEKDWIFLGG